MSEEVYCIDCGEEMTKVGVALIYGCTHCKQIEFVEEKIKAEMKKVAKLIVKYLNCDCGFKPIKAQKEPCGCGWTPIEDFFTEYDINLSELDDGKRH